MTYTHGLGMRHTRLVSNPRTVHVQVAQGHRPPRRANGRYLNGFGFEGPQATGVGVWPLELAADIAQEMFTPEAASELAQLYSNFLEPAVRAARGYRGDEFRDILYSLESWTFTTAPAIHEQRVSIGVMRQLAVLAPPGLTPANVAVLAVRAAFVLGLSDGIRRGVADPYIAAIQRAQTTDRSVGATEEVQAAARAEGQRLEDYCGSFDEWKLIATRFLPGGEDLALQYELMCQKQLGSVGSLLGGALPWWAKAAAAVGILFAVKGVLS
jgi:hypothetical protein